MPTRRHPTSEAPRSLAPGWGTPTCSARARQPTRHRPHRFVPPPRGSARSGRSETRTSGADTVDRSSGSSASGRRTPRVTTVPSSSPNTADVAGDPVDELEITAHHTEHPGTVRSPRRPRVRPYAEGSDATSPRSKIDDHPLLRFDTHDGPQPQQTRPATTSNPKKPVPENRMAGTRPCLPPHATRPPISTTSDNLAHEQSPVTEPLERDDARHLTPTPHHPRNPHMRPSVRHHLIRPHRHRSRSTPRPHRPSAR